MGEYLRIIRADCHGERQVSLTLGKTYPGELVVIWPDEDAAARFFADLLPGDQLSLSDDSGQWAPVPSDAFVDSLIAKLEASREVANTAQSRVDSQERMRAQAYAFIRERGLWDEFARVISGEAGHASQA